MQVIPVAGFDSMLMTLSGCHAPCFTRNLVILKDSAGHTGIGEIHGGDYTHDGLMAMRELVVGTPDEASGLSNAPCSIFWGSIWKSPCASFWVKASSVIG